jgi:hypothetical protein
MIPAPIDPCDATSVEAVSYLSSIVKYRSHCWAFVKSLGFRFLIYPYVLDIVRLLYFFGHIFFLYFLPMTSEILMTLEQPVSWKDLCELPPPRGEVEPTSSSI